MPGALAEDRDAKALLFMEESTFSLIMNPCTDTDIDKMIGAQNETVPKKKALMYREPNKRLPSGLVCCALTYHR